MFFSWMSFPQAPEYTIKAVSSFFWKFGKIFAAQGSPTDNGKFSTGVNNLGDHIFLKDYIYCGDTRRKLAPVPTTQVLQNENTTWLPTT